MEAVRREQVYAEDDGSFDLAHSRLWLDEYAALIARGHEVEGVETEDKTIATPNGPVRTRLYNATGAGPTLVFVHGGGWDSGDRREYGFAGRALSKGSDHGQDPSNIIDHGYPLGAVNLAGQTPIILVNDAPSTGGFINPFTVASAAFWKLAQAKPGDILRWESASE